MNVMRRGCCLCGQVQVVLRNLPLAIASCHCNHCRKTSGAAFSLVAILPAQAVDLSGEVMAYDDIADSGARISRRFCGRCGSPVETASSITEQQGIRIIKLGLFDEINDLRPSVELFCRSRAGWLPPFEEARRYTAMQTPDV